MFLILLFLVLVQTTFDMASLTKVLATTTTAMLLYDKGVLDLNMEISNEKLLGAQFSQNGKEKITVRNLLLHDSGFPPDPVPGYGAASFGCPETAHFHPKLSFSCIPKIFNSVLHQTLQNPVGAVYVYSDLSMITAAFALGKLIQVHNLVSHSDLLQSCVAELSGPPAYHCYFEAFLRTHVVRKLGMARSGFLLDPNRYPQATPTWNDTTYRHELLQGVVSDENAFAAGGYAGHAGFWSTTSDTYLLTKALMFGGDSFIRHSTVELFTKAYNLTQSSRALGWDTNDYTKNTYRGCATLSSKTYTHLGYTGTETCNDPERKLITILLTNRVYPGKTNSADLIHALRQSFNTAVQQAFDTGAFSTEIQESVPVY
jgi:CubicO group peptidase (beta-lactamase class C family)